MAQLINITSEALQATIRRLLPSQQGFGEDLQASNIITPIIDLTPSAEGSETRADLQTALAFGSQTAFSATNATDVIANSPGFYKITGIFSIGVIGSAATAKIQMSDGLSTKDILLAAAKAQTAENQNTFFFDITVFLAAGESISAIASSQDITIAGSSRQIADVNGTLVNPSGFTPQ